MKNYLKKCVHTNVFQINFVSVFFFTKLTFFWLQYYLLSVEHCHGTAPDPSFWACVNVSMSGSIFDIGLDKFFCHYWAPSQIDVYKSLSKIPGASVRFDATGSVCIMEHRWAYSERSNMRKRAVKRVNDMILSLDSDISASLGVNQTQEESVVASCSGAASSEFADSYGSEEEVDCEIESETSEDEDSSPSDLRSSLSDWAVEFGVSLVALSALLSILRVHHPFLPKDGRSLLKTRTQYVVENIAGGSFYYFGILNTLGKTFHEIASKVPDRHTFKLQLNFDGLPLFKNSSVQFWPVLGKLQEYATKGPVLIAVFCGESKPTSLSEYLSALVKELKTLSDGFIVGGKVFFVKVSSVMCDAPARAFIKGIKSHTGYAGCDKCVQSGVYMNHRMTFPETHAACRTDESFRVNADEDHHLHQSPLLETDIGMVSCFPHDYMHLVCLGVVRKCLDLWMGSTGPLRCRLSTRESDAVSERLMALRSFVPVEFARKPRRLSERLRWKATELRQSLLYTGPVVLRDLRYARLEEDVHVTKYFRMPLEVQAQEVCTT
ncbi:uncharacterized protein LOC143509924 isoform X4 [Brachyhypopomus gauderio]|uniref:uncharacterized protein LOC143509924 isoform X4 n=1 Tax=Brachyhypopomus gauderio TaxID=698409 RepID=UPI00404248DF